MSNTTPSSVPAGWYPDPAGTPRQRWWDGAAWTDHYTEPPVAAQPAAAEPVAPQPAYGQQQAYGQQPAYAQQAYAGAQQPYAYAAQDLKAPAGTQPYNNWIWMILGGLALSYTVSLIFSALSPSVGIRSSLLTSSVSLLIGVAIYGAIVFFAFQDHKALTALGVPRPFHWAWAFISPVYPIGRSVIVQRRTGLGILPMWITIGLLVLYFIVAVVISVVSIQTTYTQFGY